MRRDRGGKTSRSSGRLNFLTKFNSNCSNDWEMLSEYISSSIKITFRCKKCQFITNKSPKAFFKSGCQKCYFNSRCLSIKDFIERFEKIWPIGQFDYSKSVYKGNKEKIC